jgi:hypothetical protein
MNSIFNFIRLDYLSLKPYRKMLAMNLVSLIFLFIPPSFTPMQRLTMLMTFLSLTAVETSPYLFASSEKTDMQRLYAALPLNKNEFVIGRYLGGILLEVGCILSVSLLACLYIVMTAPSFFPKLVLLLCTTIGLFLILMALEYPSFVQFGFAKSQTAAVLVPTAVFYLGWFFVAKHPQQFSQLSENYFGIILIILGIIFQLISIRISCTIFQAKEL